MSSPRVSANGIPNPVNRKVTKSISSDKLQRVQSPPKNLAPIRTRTGSVSSSNEPTVHNIFRQTSASNLNKPILGKPQSASSSEYSLGLNSQDVDVSGRERTKYFVNKAEDEENYTSGSRLGNRTSVSAGSVASSIEGRPVNQPLYRERNARYPESPHVQPNGTRPQMVSVEVQTMYRESEAQTDPYEPDYFLEEGQPKPEVVHLAELGLSYGHGLPVGPDEILKIERARQKRSFEASLPPITDKESLELRKKKMEEQEELEWSYREEEFRKVQQQRLEMTENALTIKEQERELFNSYKVQSIMMRAVEKKEGTLDKIERERVQIMRKIEKDRELLEGKKSKRDIIEDYSDHGSRVYAPMTREGRRRDAYVLQDIKPPSLEAVEGIETVEKRLRLPVSTSLSTTMESNIENSNGSTMTMTQAPAANTQDLLKYREKAKPKTGNERQEKQIRDNLDKLEQTLKSSKSDDGRSKQDRPSIAQKIEKPPPRPPTPSVEPMNEEEEEQEQAILLLQYLIRGRAIQNAMYEGKGRRAELIAELKAANNYREVDLPRETEQLDLKMTAERSKRDNDQNKVSDYEAHIEMLALSSLEDALGSVVGSALDFLSKELVRSRQVKQLEAFVQIAERTRRIREAEESGRRQVEQEMRINQDEQYRQIMEVHKRTATTYFDSILEDAIIEIHAREEIRLKKLHEEDEKRLALLPTPPENVINDLVFGYLFPLVEQNSTKEQASLEVNKHKKAVWSSMDLIIPTTVKAVET